MADSAPLPLPPIPSPLRGQAANPGAVALAYRAGDSAPRVVAKGRGLIAEDIIRRAREAGVYVHESPELMGLLLQVDLDRHIPPALYLAIAELLAWLYRCERVSPDPTVELATGAG